MEYSVMKTTGHACQLSWVQQSAMGRLIIAIIDIYRQYNPSLIRFPRPPNNDLTGVAMSIVAVVSVLAWNNNKFDYTLDMIFFSLARGA